MTPPGEREAAQLVILVVEDNGELIKLLRKLFTGAGFNCDVAGSAEDALQMLALRSYAAVVLDLGLPGQDGHAVVRSLRERGASTPVLMLTARGAVRDRVAGLQAGADDYLVKPFAPEELVARLRALLRRPGMMAPRMLRLGRLTLDRDTRETTVDGNPHILAGRELQLLELLLEREGRVVAKTQVEQALFELGSELGSNAIEVYVHRLRRRLQQMSAGVEVVTVRGVGYMLACSA